MTLSLEKQRRFECAVLSNEFISSVLGKMRHSDLPGWYLSGGCVFQTVWNVEHGFHAAANILDYDLFYFDGSDLSERAEQVVGEEVRRMFADLPIEIEVRNQARVHLWYEEEYGAPCPAFQRCEDGIDGFLATCCCFGVREMNNEQRVIYAPHGFDDLFDLVVRPNFVRTIDSRTLGPVYESKILRWCSVWPRLKSIPWPAAGPSCDATTRLRRTTRRDRQTQAR